DVGINDIAFLDSTTILFVGATDFVGKSKDLGYTVTGSYLPKTEQSVLNGIVSLNNNNAVTVGEHGKIFRTTDAGKTWIEQNSHTLVPLLDVAFVDSSNGWAVGEGGVILHTINGGYSSVTTPFVTLPNVELFPNPAGTSITVNYNLPVTQHVTITLLDISGDI